MKINDVEFEILKNYYHKSTVGPDGITHTIDTSREYTVYQFGLAKNYFTEDKMEVLGQIIGDLKDVIVALEELRGRESSKENKDDEGAR